MCVEASSLGGKVAGECLYFIKVSQPYFSLNFEEEEEEEEEEDKDKDVWLGSVCIS